MARRKHFGNYAIRAIGHKDKAKWVTEVTKTAAQAKAVAKRLALSKLGTYAPTVCIFDLSRWGKRPVCIRAEDVAGYRNRSRYGINPRRRIHVVRYQP